MSVEQMTIISICNWSGARNWVEWWTRTKHLQMLSKPFAKMALSTWNKAPRNTNGVERGNLLAKDGDSKRKSLYCAMQSMYEKDKDSTASLGPPDKKQHFDNSQMRKTKAQNKK